MRRVTILEFLDDHKLEKDDPQGRIPTHYGLNCRKYYIPESDNKAFLLTMAYGLFTNTRHLYLVERKTTIFKMHMDLDFIQRTVVSLDDVKILTRMLTVIMRSFYPSVSDVDASKLFSSVILTAPPKRVKVNEEPMVKSGYHIMWPFLHVSTVQALAMRYACVMDAEQRLPKRLPPCNAYSDILDECVLKENGLRMIGNDKCSPCECNKKREPKGVKPADACHVCDHSRYVAEKRPYLPVAMLDGDGFVDALREAQILGVELRNYRYKVGMCSTREFSPCTPGFQQPLLAPVCPLGKVKRPRASASSSEQQSAKKFKDGVEIGETTETFQQMQSFLQTRMGDAYENIVLKKMLFISKGGGYYICNVSGSGSSFCRNVERAHTQSHIYFRVEETKGVFQRCFCSKNNATGTKVACKYYNGPCVQLPFGLRLGLFTKTALPGDAAGPNGRSKLLTTEDSKLAAFDCTLEHIEDHISENRISGLSVSAAVHAVTARREQELRLSYITGRTISTVNVVQKNAPGVDLTWRELDGLSMRELRKVDEKRAREEASSAVRMRTEVSLTKSGKNAQTGLIEDKKPIAKRQPKKKL